MVQLGFHSFYFVRQPRSCKRGSPKLPQVEDSLRARASSHAIYRLYALSNLGSMLALLSYPLLVEPWLPTRLQAWIWSGAYLIFVVLSFAVTWRRRATVAVASSHHTSLDDPPTKFSDRCFSILLPSMASALLLAVSNHVLRNVAPIPLFWVIFLALYLLSFIVAFDRARWYYRPIWLTLFAVAAAILSYAAVGQPKDLRLLLGIYSSGMFVCCMVCHGELAKLKPVPRHLTSYYLSIAAGGAVGGIFVAVLAPVLFNSDIDLVVLLPVTMALIIAVVWLSLPPAKDLAGRLRRLTILAGAILIVGEFTRTMISREYADLASAVYFDAIFMELCALEMRERCVTS